MDAEQQPQRIGKVIFSSSLGTLIEWYDFYIFGSLATVISKQFFPEGQGTAALLSTLAIFAAGFIVRPFGALVFGRLGDIIGRKHTFLLTLVLMGGSTFLIGLIPGYKTIGIAAPVLVLLLRLVQGLALGGEYGGAATYVAEHAPPHRRGYFTSWIQTTATLGLFLSLGIILITKMSMTDDSFNAEWGGWRYPFWISILLVGVSIYIRLKMKESPLFHKLKSEGKTSVNPLKESFGHKTNLKMVLLALFGAVMGQGVIWYTGQFYAQSFLETKALLDFEQSRTIVLWAIAFATPFFVVWGALSDKVGRKWIMMTGMLLAILTYRPIYQKFLDVSNIETLKAAGIESSSDPVIKHNAIRYTQDTAIITSVIHTMVDASSVKEVNVDTIFSDHSKITGHAKPAFIDKHLAGGSYWLFVFLVFIQIIYVTMVYGPIAAFLVELFPTKIRYTSMSLPYHIGNGVFGGLVPFIATLITTFKDATPLSGLWYPIGVAFVCMIIGSLYLKNTIDKDVMD
jgi:MFS family permease